MQISCSAGKKSLTAQCTTQKTKKTNKFDSARMDTMYPPWYIFGSHVRPHVITTIMRDISDLHPSLCKVSAKSVQQFLSAICPKQMKNQQT